MARGILIVLDSVGIGGAEDAGRFGDAGSDTLGHIAEACGKGLGDRTGLRQGPLRLPNLARLGLQAAAEQSTGKKLPDLGHHGPIEGRFGYGVEISKGKDTPSGHWEMAGVPVLFDWGYFPETIPCFPQSLTDALIEEARLPGIIGNKHTSGTTIIAELGEEHISTGKPICYTSADSVFQIAAHEETVPIETLYAWCRIARRILDPWRVARVIARPFVGAPGGYARTYNRKDFALPAPGPTVLEKLVAAKVPVIGVGKIPDIFDRKGITDEIHTEGNADGLAKTEALLDRIDHGLVFVNLVDFDSLYGHRNDPAGYARALEEMDRALPRLLGKLRPGEVCALTADHGCDPTTPSTDHSREYVPLLVHAPGRGGGRLGTRGSFADLGASVAEYFGIPSEVGTSFLRDLG
jgi:phosphopentomutase